MSHTIKLSLEDREKGGLVVIACKEALDQACEALGLEAPKWVERVNLGNNNDLKAHPELLATGWAVRLPGWSRPAVFNTDTRDEWWNNWPIYEAGHPDVLAGRRRVGEGGRWGELSQLDLLRAEYVKAADAIALAELELQASLNGWTLHIGDRLADGSLELILEQ